MQPDTSTTPPPGQPNIPIPPQFQPPTGLPPNPTATPPPPSEAPQPPKTNTKLIVALSIAAGIVLLGALVVVVLLIAKQSGSSGTDATADKTTVTTTAPKQAAADNKDKTLYLADWSVSIKYSGDVTLTSAAGTDASVKFLSSTELTTADATCAAEKGGVGTLLRAKLGDVAHFSGHAAGDTQLTGQQYADKYPDETGMLGGYAYTYFIASGACATKSAAQPTIAAIKSLIE